MDNTDTPKRPLPEGFHRFSVAEIETMRRHGPRRTADETVRHIRSIAGSISIGRPPRKSDYRARWRNNGEEFDEA
ncbi:MAG: hypothetical protein WCN97_01510 [Thermoleophilia bacterium]